MRSDFGICFHLSFYYDAETNYNFPLSPQLIHSSWMIRTLPVCHTTLWRHHVNYQLCNKSDSSMPSSKEIGNSEMWVESMFILLCCRISVKRDVSIWQRAFYLQWPMSQHSSQQTHCPSCSKHSVWQIQAFCQMHRLFTAGQLLVVAPGTFGNGHNMASLFISNQHRFQFPPPSQRVHGQIYMIIQATGSNKRCWSYKIMSPRITAHRPTHLLGNIKR